MKSFLHSFIFFVGILFVMTMSSNTALAQGKCDTAGLSPDPETGLCIPSLTNLPGDGGSNAAADVTNVVLQVMLWLLGIFGFLAIIAFTIAGIMYLTSTGNEDQAKRGQQGMIYAIIGVLIGLGGVVIVRVIEFFLGNDQVYFY